MDLPIPTALLFPELHEHLLALLKGLGADDWHKPTVCSLWSVKDIASHLLDGNLRRLAAQRDGYRQPHAPDTFGSHQELMAYLNRLNAEWTQATRRISPHSLIDLLDLTGRQVSEMFRTADPDAPALFPVGWAGEEQSRMWFDIAREYTERWHHQRQIADAVGRTTPIDARHLYHPVLDTFMRALPFTFRDVAASEGTVVTVCIAGDAGGLWSIRRRRVGWIPFSGGNDQANAMLTMRQEIAWKVLTKRHDADTKLRNFPELKLSGDADLARRALEMVSIMA